MQLLLLRRLLFAIRHVSIDQESLTDNTIVSWLIIMSYRHKTRLICLKLIRIEFLTITLKLVKITGITLELITLEGAEVVFKFIGGKREVILILRSPHIFAGFS